MPQTFRRGKVAHAQERISNFKFLPGALRGEIGSQGNAGRIAFERALAMRRAAASDAAARVRDGEGRELALAQDDVKGVGSGGAEADLLVPRRLLAQRNTTRRVCHTERSALLVFRRKGRMEGGSCFWQMRA